MAHPYFSPVRAAASASNHTSIQWNCSSRALLQPVQMDLVYHHIPLQSYISTKNLRAEDWKLYSSKLPLFSEAHYNTPRYYSNFAKNQQLTSYSNGILGWISGWIGRWRDGIRKLLAKYSEWFFFVESDDRSLECVWPDSFCKDLWRFIACLKINCIVSVPSKKINLPISKYFHWLQLRLVC